MSDKSLEKVDFDGVTDEFPEIESVLNSLTPEKRKVILQALTITKQHHSGPLPDAETIRVYSEVIPDGGNRLMKTVEKQQDHRIEVEKIGVRRSFNQSSTGQWMGFFISIVFGIIAWDLAKSGYQVAATILGTVDLVALVTVFLRKGSKS